MRNQSCCALTVLRPLPSLQACVQLLELLAPEIHEPLAALLVVGLVGAEECPVLVVLDPLHKEIRDPEPIEEIAGTLLLLTVVLAKLQEIENVRMPGLEVHSEGALPLASALIHIPTRDPSRSLSLSWHRCAPQHPLPSLRSARNSYSDSVLTQWRSASPSR